MDSHKINFSFVVHTGRLEVEAILLTCSIRYFHSETVNIFAGIPKHLGGISSGITDKTKNILQNLGVVLFEVENPIGAEYPIGNKLDCLPKDVKGIKVFFDTDMMFLQKLKLPFMQERTIAVKPADRKTYRWNHKQWRKAYAKYSGYHDDIPLIFSTTFHEVMYPYYNAGFIAVNNCDDFSSSWCDMSKRIDGDQMLQDKRPWLDQLALPLVIKEKQYNVINLNENYNYPAHLKPVLNKSPFIVHYHWPNILARDNKVLNSLKKIVSSFPILINIFSESSTEWQNLNKSLTKKQVSKQNVNDDIQPHNVLITGIPRSGTSFMCSLLNSFDDSLVINEPKEIQFPVNKQPIPYGVLGYYAETRKNINIGDSIDNKHINGNIIQDTITHDLRSAYVKHGLESRYSLFTKNTLGYMFALERLMQAMPKTKIIALYRNPIDTIASWKTSFDHLKQAKPDEIKTIKLQKKWLSLTDNESLDYISNCKEIYLRRALFWNFLASRLLKNQHNIYCVNYKQIIQNPSLYISILREKLSLTGNAINIEPSEVKSKKELLSESEIEIIKNVTGNMYEELQNLEL